MLTRLIHAALGRAGYEVVRKGASRRVRDGRVAAHIRTVRPYTMLADHRLASLYDQVRHLRAAGVDGTLVECGVWRGGSAGVMALAVLDDPTPHRDLHLFDTFAGIPEPDAHLDGDRAVAEARAQGVAASGRLVPNPRFYTNQGRSYGPVEECLHLLTSVISYPKDRVHVYPGLFQETLPAEAEGVGPISLLHLDGDWYDSTRVCLERLYDLVVPGGLVTIDDYGAYDGCRRAVDAFFESRGIRPYLHPIDDEARTFVRP